jgi:hypothetical protein
MAFIERRFTSLDTGGKFKGPHQHIEASGGTLILPLAAFLKRQRKSPLSGKWNASHSPLEAVFLSKYKLFDALHDVLLTLNVLSANFLSPHLRSL